VFDTFPDLDPNPFSIADGRFWDPRDRELDDTVLYEPVAGKAIATRTPGTHWRWINPGELFYEGPPSGEWREEPDPATQEFKMIEAADAPADLETRIDGDWTAMSKGDVEGIVFQLGLDLKPNNPSRVAGRRPSLEIITRFLAVDSDIRSSV
jgi:hypothetical protein